MCEDFKKVWRVYFDDWGNGSNFCPNPKEKYWKFLISICLFHWNFIVNPVIRKASFYQLQRQGGHWFCGLVTMENWIFWPANISIRAYDKKCLPMPLTMQISSLKSEHSRETQPKSWITGTSSIRAKYSSFEGRAKNLIPTHCSSNFCPRIITGSVLRFVARKFGSIQKLPSTRQSKKSTMVIEIYNSEISN